MSDSKDFLEIDTTDTQDELVNTAGEELKPFSLIATALCKAQSEMTGAKKTKNNNFFKSTYSDLSSVFEAVRVPFSDNGLSISQTMNVLNNGRTVLETRLFHTSGEFLSSKMLLPDIQDPQKIGSAITYYRRYSLMAISGIPSLDDDGNIASRAVKEQTIIIDSETLLNLNAYINGDRELEENILKLCSVESLEKIKVSQILHIRNFVKKYKENNNGKS